MPYHLNKNTQVAYVKHGEATSIKQKVMRSGLGYVCSSDSRAVWSQLSISFIIAKIS